MANTPDLLSRRYRRTGTALATLVYVFLLVPSLLVIPISFGGTGQIAFPPRALSLTLYRELFSSPAWMLPLVQSLKVAFLTTLVSLVVSVPAAYGVVRTRFKGKPWLVMLLMSPAAIPVIVIALGLDLYLSRLGLTGTTVGLVVSHAVYVAPFVIVTVAAGVRKLDARLEFAATMMGAGRGTVFRHVVLPQLGPSLFAGALFAFLISFDEVVIAWFITGPSTTTLPVKMYSAIQWEISPVIAAVSTLLTVLSFVACVVAALFQRPSEVA